MDPATNHSSLSGTTLRQDFGKLIQGEYPLSFLTIFLHEITHHWCFQSPVGFSLATLRQGLLRNILSGRDHSKGFHRHFLHELIRLEAVIGMLRPLSEGLALFAEFDIRPGSGALQSQPMQWVARFHKRTDEPGGPSPPNALVPLFNARLHPATIQSKANLLVQPFDADHGGYLPGYLSVKSLWLTLIARSDRLLDSDLFLTYLRSYFFEDFSLVAHILDSKTDVEDIADVIFVHIQNRLRALWSETHLEEHVRAFEEDVLAHPAMALLGGRPSPRRGILLNDAEAQTGITRYIESTGQLTWKEPKDPLAERLKTYQLTQLLRRQFFVVAREKVVVRPAQSGKHLMCTQGGSPLCGIPACVSTEAGCEGDGTIAFIVFPASFHTATTVTLDGRVIGMFSLDDLDLRTQMDAPTREALLNFPTDEQTYRFDIDLVDELLAAVCLHDEVESFWNNFVAARDDLVSRAYAKFVTVKVPELHRHAVIASLRKQGLSQRLGGELAQVNAYALLGLCSSLRLLTLESMRDILESHGVEIDRLRELIRSNPVALPFSIGRELPDALVAHY